MHVRKTCEHGGVTLDHGAFTARETVHVCAASCTTEPAFEGERRPAVIKRQDALAQLLVPRTTVGYDVMTFVGLERYLRFRQREEIRAELDRRYGIKLSTGEISTLAQHFLVYLEALQKARAPELRKVLATDGGWPAHIDATGEGGRGTLFVVYAGWRAWVLGAWKIPTERADAILPKLKSAEARFGAPCAVVRDLGKAVIEAARDFNKGRKPKIPVLGCHLHFLKDVGKDLRADAHDSLRGHFRRFKVKSGLRSLARDLGRGLGTGIDKTRADILQWLDDDGRPPLPKDKLGLAVVRALAQWVLDYADDGTDAGFPFDRPLLDLYRRCQRGCRAAESLLRKSSGDSQVELALARFHRIVAPVRGDLPFQQPARILESRGRLFDELRDVLRLHPKETPRAQADGGDTAQKKAELRDVKKAVKALQASLRRRRPERGPAQDVRKAIDLILDHLGRHGPSLWGHAVSLPAAAGGGVRLVARTNVELESFFHEVKHGERRRSGRKVLTQDFEQLPAAAVYVRNLERPDYVAIVCGTLDALPKAFAALDAADRSRSLPVRQAKKPQDPADIVSSSLPKADRDLVRTDEMRERVAAEARSRAPRLPVRANRSGNRRLTP